MDENNHRPAGILPNLSTAFERYLFKQISNFLESIFSKFLCSFRKGRNAQHCCTTLLTLLEKLLKSMDKWMLFGTLLMDVSKAFDCLPHGLLKAKLFAYAFILVQQGFFLIT